MVGPEAGRGFPTPESMRLGVVITPESLMLDNRSPKADEGRDSFERNKAEGRLRFVEGCGDARSMIPEPEETVPVRSIAAAGTKPDKVLKSPSVRTAVSMGHFDGETVTLGKRPTGCGGEKAKEDSLNGDQDKKPVKGIEYYVRHNIQHPDVIMQSIISAGKIARQSEKPTLAAVQDHRTATIYPIAVFLQGGVHRISQIAEEDLILYKKDSIYSDGIPALDESMIPDEFKDFIEAGRKQVRELVVKYPNLREMQKVQNPRMIVLSTELMSMRLRFPKTSEMPGMIFKLHVPREKIGIGISIRSEDLEESLMQAQYPISRAVENFRKQGHSFSITDRLMIETDDMETSRDLATRLAEQEWMQDWINLQDHRIFIAQAQEGISNVEEFSI